MHRSSLYHLGWLSLLLGCGAATSPDLPDSAPPEQDTTVAVDTVTTTDLGQDTEPPVPPEDTSPPPVVAPCGDRAAVVDPMCSAVDLCARWGHECSVNATCAATETAAVCTCKEGFIGDGRSCTAVGTPDSCGDGEVTLHEACDDGNSEGGDGCSATCTDERTEEYHPKLLIREAHIPALAARLGTSTISGPVGRALEATLKGVRSEESVAYITQAFIDGSGTDVRKAMVIYDLQHAYLTPDERQTFRTQFLADAAAVYAEAMAAVQWYYWRRHVNNWIYRHAGSPLQRLLYAGLLFTDHPEAAAYRARALEFLDWVYEGGPGDGEWNLDTQSFDVPPTRGEMIDETMTTPLGYGIWGSRDLADLMHVVALNTSYAPYAKLDHMMASEARFWTYILSYSEGINFDSGFTSLAGYIGNTGHGGGPGHFTYYSNTFVLHWARVYQNPVFAWHYYANPSPLLTQDEGYLDTWSEPLKQYGGWRQFLDWGAVEPTSPEVAQWPLTAFWPHAGIGVIRKRWEKKGPGSGVVFLRAGPGASHDRPAVGTVQLHADGHTLLGAGPSSYDYDILTIGWQCNNTLAVDGVGQHHFTDIERWRQRHAKTIRLGEDTFLMTMKPETDVGYLTSYPEAPGLEWTRKVRYDREVDVLWIKDVARMNDGVSHEFTFNWVSDAKVAAPDMLELPGGYVMVSEADTDLALAAVTYLPEAYAFTAGVGTAYGETVSVRWAIGPDEAVARAYLARHRGAFVTAVERCPTDDGFSVSWWTDEPTTGRVEYGATPALGESAAVVTASTQHSLLLPASARYFQVVAVDSHGDETVADMAGSPYPVCESP